MPVPYTTIRTSHAISIRVNNKVIGQIQNWAPNQARNVSLKYEINAVGTGAPIENVPGIGTGYTISVGRYDLYSDKMEEVWGSKRPLWMLTDQHNPIDIEEKWVTFGEKGVNNPFLEKIGNSTFGKKLGIGTKNELKDTTVGATPFGTEISVEKFWYTGCWFSQLGRNIQAQGDRIVMVNATLNFVKVRAL